MEDRLASMPKLATRVLLPPISVKKFKDSPAEESEAAMTDEHGEEQAPAAEGEAPKRNAFSVCLDFAFRHTKDLLEKTKGIKLVREDPFEAALARQREAEKEAAKKEAEEALRKLAKKMSNKEFKEARGMTGPPA